MGKWDACLVATINQLSSALDEHGPDCVSQSTLLALCCVLASHHTCTMWLMSLLAHPAASGSKGKKNYLTGTPTVILLRMYGSQDQVQ